MSLSVDQSAAIDKLEKLKVGALFMEPGTGKTRVTISLINSSNADFVLFVCPFQTKANLLAEINRWGLDFPFEIVGVETISMSDNTYMRIRDEISKKKHVFMVVDESLNIKNKHAIRTRRVLDLAQFSEFRLILNGTPISKNIMDLWSQFEFLSPKILGMQYYEFLNNFVEYIDYRDNGKPIEIRSYKNLDYLYSIIKPFVFDAKLDLNIESKEQDSDYMLSYEAEANYRRIKNHYIYDVAVDNANIFFAMIQEMQQSYCDDEDKVNTALRIANRLGLDDTLIFCKFIRSKVALENCNPQLNVLTYGKGSYGLNLQKYHHIIFFDKTFDYAQLEQAKRRIYRMGQYQDVSFHFMTGNVGLESMIDRNIEHKETISGYFKRMVVKGRKKELLDEL